MSSQTLFGNSNSGKKFLRILSIVRRISLNDNLLKYTEHKCQTKVSTLTAGLSAVPLGNSIDADKCYI